MGRSFTAAIVIVTVALEAVHSSESLALYSNELVPFQFKFGSNLILEIFSNEILSLSAISLSSNFNVAFAGNDVILIILSSSFSTSVNCSVKSVSAKGKLVSSVPLLLKLVTTGASLTSFTVIVKASS